MRKIRKNGIALMVAIMAILIAVPAQALIINADVASNAGISYSKLKLSKKITSKDIKNGTIKGDDIDDEAIDTDQLNDDAVTSDKIADGTIVAADIAADTIVAGDIATGAVTTTEILDSTIASADIAADTIVAADIATGGVGAAEIGDDVVDGADLADTITLDAALAINGFNVNLGADLTVGGGNLLLTGLATCDDAAGTAGEICYDSLDGNLYVYDGIGLAWRDLTAGAAGLQTLDDSYNASGGPAVVLVDNGDLTLRSNAGATGDIIVDLNSTGDFLIQDAGTIYATFSDTGVVTLAAGTTFNVDGDTIDADGALDITGATGLNVNSTAGDLTVDSNAGSIIIDAGEAGQDDGITIVTTGAGSGINITSLADIDIATTGAAGEDISLTNTGGSVNVTASEADAAAIVLNASGGGVDVTAATNDLDLVASTLDVNITGATNVDLAATAGDVTVASGDDILLNPTDDITATMAAAGGILVDAATTDNTITTGVLDMNVDAGNAAVDGINIDIEAAGAIAAATDITGMEMLLTATDVDADMFGVSISTHATAGVAGSYVAGLFIDDADDTAGSMPDAILVTSSGVDTGVTDAVDVSAANITNALNVGANNVTGTDWTILNTTDAAESLTFTSAGGVGYDITGEAGQDFRVTNTGGSIALNASEAAVDAITLNASAGGLNVDSALAMDIDTTAGNIVIDSVDGGAGAILPEDNSEDSLGADATRWATIFADTLNYTTAITDDNSANTTVTIGDSNALDTLTVTANTTITDAQWSVTAAGVAAFAGINGPIGGVTPAAIDATTIQLDAVLTFDTNDDSINNSADDTFDFTREDSGTVTITASDDNDVAALVVTPGSTGALTLGTNAATTSITLATDATGTAEVVLPAGSIDSTEILDATIAGTDLVATIAITTSGTLTSTGVVDFTGATSVMVRRAAGAPAVGGCDAAAEIGSLYADTTDDAATVLYVCGSDGDGAGQDWQTVTTTDID